MLYSDKTTVSSFNGRTFHPVIARIGNLPASIRNSRGAHGGGTLIAYIPQVGIFWISLFSKTDVTLLLQLW